VLGGLLVLMGIAAVALKSWIWRESTHPSRATSGGHVHGASPALVTEDSEIEGRVALDQQSSRESTTLQFGGSIHVQAGSNATRFLGNVVMAVEEGEAIACQGGSFLFERSVSPDTKFVLAASLRIEGQEFELSPPTRIEPRLDNRVILRLEQGLKLRVTSAVSGEDLTAVEVFKRGSKRKAPLDPMGDERYGEVGPTSGCVLIASGPSPLSLAADELPGEYWVTSPGHSWFGLEVSSLERNYSVALRPAGSVTVIIDELEEGASSRVVAYAWNARAKRFMDRPATSIAAQPMCEISGLAPGRYLIALEANQRRGVRVVDTSELYLEDPEMPYRVDLRNQEHAPGTLTLVIEGAVHAAQNLAVVPLELRGIRAKAGVREQLDARGDRHLSGPHELPAGAYYLQISPLGLVADIEIAQGEVRVVEVDLAPLVSRRVAVQLPGGQPAHIKSVLWSVTQDPEGLASLHAFESASAPPNPLELLSVPGPLRIFVDVEGFGVQSFPIPDGSSVVTMEPRSIVQVRFEGIPEVPSISLLENIRCSDLNGMPLSPVDFQVGGAIGEPDVAAFLFFAQEGPVTLEFPPLWCCGAVRQFSAGLERGRITLVEVNPSELVAAQ